MNPDLDREPHALTPGEIQRIVNRWIGVEGGYLGDFSYASHAAFYPEYCDLDIDAHQYEGTTKWRFIEILKSQSPVHQARIIRGVIERFPLDQDHRPTTRTPELRDELLRVVERCDGYMVDSANRTMSFSSSEDPAFGRSPDGAATSAASVEAGTPAAFFDWFDIAPSLSVDGLPDRESGGV